MQASPFAYSMAQADTGWTWRLWDVDGEVVAAGHAPDQSSAEQRVAEAYERSCTRFEASWAPSSRSRRSRAGNADKSA